MALEQGRIAVHSTEVGGDYLILDWVAGISTAVVGVIAAVTGVGRMPLTPQERRAANSIAQNIGVHTHRMYVLRLFKENIGEDFDDVDEAIRFITRSMRNMRQEIEILRHNNEGRRMTIAMLKGMAVEERFHWERINHECPVELHPDIGINSAGAVINPLTGRYL